MNKVIPAMKIAFRALRINKLRSALTMLGIIIGVGAVIAMVAVGSGATQRIQEQIASIGTNVQGTTPDYLIIRDIAIQNGLSFTQQDVDSDAKVALLGQTVVDNLFNGDDPIGQVIRIKHVPFTVVGTLVPKGQSPTGQDQDDIIIVPITTGQKKIFGVSQVRANSVGSLIVQARGPQAIAPAQDEMRSVLRQRHHLQPQQDDDFTIRNLEEVFKAQETSSHVMSILLAAIASVSLVVGGIGIMNIMLVSVTERTREIGLRQAV